MKTILILLFSLHSMLLLGQHQTKRASQMQVFEQDSINGIYIPKNLEDCFRTLNQTLKEEDIATIKNLESREDVILYHHGFGTWLRNNWGLWSGSRIQTYLRKRKLRHPDDMSHTILEFYYDWLNGDHEAWQRFEKNKHRRKK